MTQQQVNNWLDEYGAAWIAGDPQAVIALFTQNATYRETPFDTVIVGREAIRNYWQEGAQDAQKDVTFASQLWSVTDNFAIAGWQANFKRLPSGVSVTLDGVFRIEFETSAGKLLCTRLEEWWHRKEA